MKRAIKFKGKREHTSEWLIGNLLCVTDECLIFPEEVPHSYNVYCVDPETVCQFTGLFDSEGNVSIHAPAWDATWAMKPIAKY